VTRRILDPALLAELASVDVADRLEGSRERVLGPSAH
jgi:hypothetical protein